MAGSVDKRTIVITGASDGIGAAAARQLAARAHRMVIVGRSAEKTARVAKELGAPFHLADYTDLRDVRRLAHELEAAYPRIDVLANNAGGLFPVETTRDGFDQTTQINHLSGFLLTHLLLDRLVASNARVIQTSSSGAKWLARRMAREDFDGRSSRGPFGAYGDSKLMNQLFTKELHRRYHAKGIHAVSYDPGYNATSFGDRGHRLVGAIFHSPVKFLLSPPSKGGAGLAWLAEGIPGETWRQGTVYDNGKPSASWNVNRQVEDAALASALWERSERLLGLDSR